MDFWPGYWSTECYSLHLFSLSQRWEFWLLSSCGNSCTYLYACQPYTVREQIINISATRFLNALDEISNVGLHSRHLCNFFPQGLLQRRLSKNKILTTVTFSWIPNVGYASCYGYFEETQILTTTKKYTRFPLTLMSRLPAHFLENTAPELQITSWSFKVSSLPRRTRASGSIVLSMEMTSSALSLSKTAINTCGSFSYWRNPTYVFCSNHILSLLHSYQLIT